MTKVNEINNLTKNRAYRIEIFSFSNEDMNKKITFPAFLTAFTDSYKSNWNEEQVYGKMDPIATFKNTARTINMAFDIPNDSIETAQHNLRQIDFLIRGLYPVYDNGVMGTAVLASPPMFRVRFSNLVRNVAQVSDDKFLRTGLLCYMKGFDFTPKVDSGFFTSQYGNLFPKLISANLSLNIIHEHPLGKSATEDGKVSYRSNFEGFPHVPGTAKVAEYRKNNPARAQADKDVEQAESDATNGICLNGG